MLTACLHACLLAAHRCKCLPVAVCRAWPYTHLPFAPQKAATVRTATAGARVLLGPEVFDLVSKNQLKKGDVLTVAQLAGAMQQWLWCAEASCGAGKGKRFGTCNT